LFIHVTIQNNKYLEKNIMSNNEIWLTYIRFPNYNKLKNKKKTKEALKANSNESF